MKKEQKRLLILLAILLSAGIYWLYDWQKGSYRVPKVPQVAVKPIEETTLTSFVATKRVAAAERSPVTEIKVRRVWGRDPFQLPDGVEVIRKTPDKEPTSGEQKEEHLPKVTCIFINGSQKVATINGKNCCKGDMMGEEKVIEILPDKVILEKGKAKREILLERGNIPIVKRVK